MSSVVVQIGQCGNQVGEKFSNLVTADARLDSSTFLNGDGHLRSVLIDSEPKVIRRILKGDKGFIDAKNVINTKRGRGGNWALGYYGLHNGMEGHIVKEAVEAVRTEAERCHSFSGVILLHSLSGGTGSGLGSRLAESLRDEFPMSYELSCVVAPHRSGESPLQNYNALLCLATLQRNCDGVLLFHNDELLETTTKRARTPTDNVGVGVAEFNKHIANCLGGLFLPADSTTPKNTHSIGLEPWELLRSVCPMPSTKFMHANTLNRSKVTWDAMAGQLVHRLKKFDDSDKPYRALSLLCAARGDTTGSFPIYLNEVEKKLKAGYHPVSWNPFPVDFWTSKHTTSTSKNATASLTVAANYSNMIDYASHVWSSAREKYQSRAFLHWYEKYGCESEDFEQAFETVAGIAHDYAAAVL